MAARSTADVTSMHKLLRTIRLDASDTFVFAQAASAGEWAVPGTFVFWDHDLSTISGREKQAFRSGFLGLGSFGWSTLAVVVEASAQERESAVEALTRHLMDHHGAPDLAAARAAAEEELAYAEELARHPFQTLVALHRKVTADGRISEQFRTFAKADARQATAMACSTGAFAIVDDDGSDDPSAAPDGETLDLTALAAARRPATAE